MHDEADFLRELLKNPADDSVRLVYADWLDEQGDPVSQTKAQFLRITAKLLEPNRSAGWRKARRKELQPVAASLPTDWLAVVSRLPVENCGGKRAESESYTRFGDPIDWDAFLESAAGRELRRKRAESESYTRFGDIFEFVCDKRWDEMATTDNGAVRLCDACKQAVHYCDTITEARQHAQQGHCIAVDLGIIRRPDDLSRPRVWLGRPSKKTLREEEERCRVDEVSRAREEAKRPAHPEEE